MTRPDVLPSAICTASAPRIGIFRGSMAGLCAPLSTLRRNPRGQLRMTRGRCGSVGWDRGADRASNDADVSSIPPIIPYGGFSPVRLEGWRFGRRLPNASLSLSLLPAYADHVLVCFRPSCIPSYPRMSRSVSARLRADAPPWRVGNPPPQGSSLESGLCCPGLSSLNRPHPPHSQAHHDFAARRLIRNAFAGRGGAV